MIFNSGNTKFTLNVLAIVIFDINNPDQYEAPPHIPEYYCPFWLQTMHFHAPALPIIHILSCATDAPQAISVCPCLITSATLRIPKRMFKISLCFLPLNDTTHPSYALPFPDCRFSAFSAYFQFHVSINTLCTQALYILPFI